MCCHRVHPKIHSDVLGIIFFNNRHRLRHRLNGPGRTTKLRRQRSACLRHAHGFTLVELLVVIAIIGVLIGLLLPAVQQAREASRRISCTNNLKQLGTALHLYNDANKKLPPGGQWKHDLPWANPPSPNPERGSVMVKILPFIEQNTLYEQIDFEGNASVQTQSVGGKLVRQYVIPTYVCPTDVYDGQSGMSTLWNSTTKVGFSNYSGNFGPNHLGGNGNPNCSCTIDMNTYRPKTGFGQDNPAGVFTRRGNRYQCRFNDILDGLSNTIFFGEVRVQCSYHHDYGWAASNNGQGMVQTLVPLNYDSCGNDASMQCAARCNWQTEFGFKSRHPGTVSFLMGDGSVRALNENVDHAALQLLGHRADGRPTPTL